MDQKHTRLILSFVTCAGRPLRLVELACLLVQHETAAKLNLKDAKELVKHSNHVVQIEWDETVRLTDVDDENVKSSTATSPNPTSFAADSPHSTMAVLCLQYLNGCPYEREKKNKKSHNMRSRPGRAAIHLKHPLLHYAVDFLPFHLQRAETENEDHQALHHHYLDAEIVNKTNALRIFENLYDGGFHFPRPRHGGNAAHLACFLGLTGYARHLLRIYRSSSASSSEEIFFEARDGGDSTPLALAAAQGHADVVQLLLDHGVDPNPDGEGGMTPLHHAASNEHPEVARLLMSVGGVSPLTKQTDKGDPDWNSDWDMEFYQALTWGRTPAKMALDSDPKSSTALEFMKYLEPDDMSRSFHWLSPGIFHGNNKHSALFNAAQEHDVKTVKALLESGADPNQGCQGNGYNKPNKRGPTPIHAWAGYGSVRRLKIHTPEARKRAIDCLELLVKAGGKVDGVMEGGPGEFLTPLLYTVYGAHDISDETQQCLVEALLALGANPNAELAERGARSGMNKQSVALVHFVTPNKHETWRTLFKHGARFDAPSQHGRSVLHERIAMGPRCGKDVQFLINLHGVKEHRDTTILHTLLGRQPSIDQDVLWEVMKAGYPVDGTNSKGEPPIFSYGNALLHRVKDGDKMRVDKQIITELIDKYHMDMNSTNRNGRNVLWRVLSAKSSERNREKHFKARKAAMEILVDLGVDIKLKNENSHYDLLQSAIRASDSLEMVQFLIANNLGDPRQIRRDDGSGNNFIHSAVMSYRDDPNEGLIVIRALAHEYGVSPSARNSLGQTVLHLVCMTTGHDDDGVKHSSRRNTGKQQPTRWIDLILNAGIFFAMTTTTIEGEKTTEGGVINCPDNQGLTPLHYAAHNQGPSQLLLLLNRGADPNSLTTTTGRSPLHYACSSGQTENVSLLLSHGAVPTIRDTGGGGGLTPLHAVAEFILSSSDEKKEKNKRRRELVAADLVRILCSGGADPNALDERKRTPRDLAREMGYPELAIELSLLLRSSEGKMMLNNNKDDQEEEARDLLRLDDADSRAYRDAKLAAYVGLGESKVIEAFARLGGSGRVVSMAYEDEHGRRHGDEGLLVDMARDGGWCRIEMLGDVFRGIITAVPEEEETERRGRRPSLFDLLRWVCQSTTTDEEKESPLDRVRYIVEEMGADPRGLILPPSLVGDLTVDDDEENLSPSPTRERGKAGRERSSSRNSSPPTRVYEELFQVLETLVQGGRSWHAQALDYLAGCGAFSILPCFPSDRTEALFHPPLKRGWSLGSETVKVLLKHGLKPSGELLGLVYDADLGQLLIDHGADPTAFPYLPEIFLEPPANLEMLELVIKAGLDPNYLEVRVDRESLRKPRPSISAEDHQQSGEEDLESDEYSSSNESSDSDSDSNSEDGDEFENRSFHPPPRYLLHRASLPIFLSPDFSSDAEQKQKHERRQWEQTKLVQLLLRNGADPLARYPDDGDGVSVLESVISDHGLFQPLLDSLTTATTTTTRDNSNNNKNKGSSTPFLPLISASIPTSPRWYYGDYIPYRYSPSRTVVAPLPPPTPNLDAIVALLLLKQGGGGAAIVVDPNAKDSNGMTALDHLCRGAKFPSVPMIRHDDPALVSLVLGTTTTTNSSSSSSFANLLSSALRNGQLGVARTLVRHGGGVGLLSGKKQDQEEDSNTALHWCARARGRIIVLVDGDDEDDTDITTSSADANIEEEIEDAFRYFLSLSSRRSRRRDGDGLVDGKKKNTMMMINARNDKGETPVFVLLSRGWPRKRLGSQENDNRGYEKGRGKGGEMLRMVDLFIDAGADFFTTDDDGNGLLHAVLRRKRRRTGSYVWRREDQGEVRDVVRRLLGMGLDPRRENKDGVTAMDVVGLGRRGMGWDVWDIFKGGGV